MCPLGGEDIHFSTIKEADDYLFQANKNEFGLINTNYRDMSNQEVVELYIQNYDASKTRQIPQSLIDRDLDGIRTLEDNKNLDNVTKLALNSIKLDYEAVTRERMRAKQARILEELEVAKRERDKRLAAERPKSSKPSSTGSSPSDGCVGGGCGGGGCCG